MENKKHEYVGRIVIVRCNRAGVFFGTLADFDSATREAKLENVRRVYYWDGAATLSQMAMEGVNRQSNCKITMAVDEMRVMDVIEILTCTDEAIANLNSVEIWKR